MRTQIIEILQKKYPEYCMQHIDTADEILRLFDVSKSFSCANEKMMEKQCDKQCMSCAVEDIRKIAQ